jgi:hypothetical protein
MMVKGPKTKPAKLLIPSKKPAKVLTRLPIPPSFFIIIKN